VSSEEEAVATYHPIPSSGTLTLRRRSSCSFDCSDVPALVDWLAQYGYQPTSIRSQYEYARLRRGHELVVVYQSGAIVCQGDGAATAIELLSELEVIA
jgi:hypothetical protein